MGILRYFLNVTEGKINTLQNKDNNRDQFQTVETKHNTMPFFKKYRGIFSFISEIIRIE